MTLLFTLVLGAVGFLCGFVGPIVLAPGANQGPLLGIFITGPGGVLLGLGLGLSARVFGWPPPARRRVLLGAAVTLAAVTLFASIPSPRERADLVEAELRGCRDAATLREATVARLNEAEARRADGHARTWDEEFDRALAQRPGSLVGVHLLRTRRIFEKQARWNQGRLAAGAWVAADRDADYFVDAAALACPAAPGTRLLLAVSGSTGIWRPLGIAEILDLRVAEPADRRYGMFSGDR